MALRTYRSNRIEALAEVLGSLVRTSVPPDPFAPVRIVVGNHGTARWLRDRLAMHAGICANVEFPFVEDAIDAMVGRILARDEASDPWSPATLTWAILEVLPGVLDLPELARVREYVGLERESIDARAYGLAREIAGTFAEVVTFRPEVARAWSKGEVRGGLDGLEWAATLWRAVAQQLGDRPHRALQMAEAERRLRSGAHQEPTDPLRLFAVSTLPPAWMSFLGALSDVIDVDLFLLCPSDRYWANLTETHPLLLSMGRVARDFQTVLESQPDGYEDERIDLFINPERHFPDPFHEGRPRALQWLQADLLAARPPQASGERPPLATSDDSVQFHSCFGPTRQVEVLRDVLLGLFEEHRDLGPSDVLVLATDLETTAPLVTAVFSDAAPGVPRIPVEIADSNVRRLNPVADAVLRVLDMVGGRLEASTVVDLLSLEPVRRRFSLSPEEVGIARTWVEEVGIRWGIDRKHRSEHGQPADDQNTWRFGLRRLLLGVVMADDGRTFEGVRPFDTEGPESRALGKLVEFCNTLFVELDALSSPRPVADWRIALDHAIEALTATTVASAWTTRRVREALVEIEASARDAASSRPVSLDAIRGAVSGRLAGTGARITKEYTGAVTFSAMAPMRGVPFRVICLLGMDDEAFPRKSSGSPFDLLGRPPRVGDRDERDEDRYLLLEALLAARQHFIVLYTGREPHTNAKRPPCGPICELMDAIENSDRLVTEHPLQAWSPRAFLPVHCDPRRPGEKRPWSFDARLLSGAKTLVSRSRAEAPLFLSNDVTSTTGESTEVTLDELIRFFKNPTEYLIRRRLQVDLRDEPETIANREPVEVRDLERWRLRDALLRDHLEGLSAWEVAGAFLAEGRLPLGYAGRATFDRESVVIAEMMAVARRASAGRPAEPPIPLDLDLGGIRLTGSLPSITGDFLIHFDFGTEDAKRLVEPWIRLLAWHASAPQAGRALVVLGDVKAGEPSATTWGFDRPDRAKERLERLVALYREGCHRSLPLFRRASWAFAKAAPLEAGELDAGLPEDPGTLAQISKAFRSALKGWSGGYDDGDTDDPHVARVYEGQNPLRDDAVSPIPVNLTFARAALTLWAPAVRARTTPKDVARWFER